LRVLRQLPSRRESGRERVVPATPSIVSNVVTLGAVADGMVAVVRCALERETRGHRRLLRRTTALRRGGEETIRSDTYDNVESLKAVKLLSYRAVIKINK
jgi:hypothetical protein